MQLYLNGFQKRWMDLWRSSAVARQSLKIWMLVKMRNLQTLPPPLFSLVALVFIKDHSFFSSPRKVGRLFDAHAQWQTSIAGNVAEKSCTLIT
jgi:hypothetical protein